MKKSKVFTPLNLSFSIQKYSNSLIIGIALGVIVLTIGIIITVKASVDLMFSPIFGSGWFKAFGFFVSFYVALFIFRKVGLREHELTRLYNEMIDHEITTINDLWDILSLDGAVATYADNSCKVFLRCEKGFVISRPEQHREQHYKALEQFLKFLLDKGYSIDYYNYRDRNANTEPLANLEDRLNSNPNRFLRDYGNSVIKYCRNLEYQCSDSEIEYFVITSRDQNMSAYLEASVESATEFLQGSLYEDIRICGMDDIVEFIELINRIKGINIQEMLTSNALRTTQKVINVIKVFGANDSIDDSNSIESGYVDDNDELNEMLELLNTIEEDKRKSRKRNLARKRAESDIKPVSPTANNIISEDDIPIPIEDDAMPMPITDDDVMPVPMPIEDDDTDELLDDELSDVSNDESINKDNDNSIDDLLDMFDEMENDSEAVDKDTKSNNENVSFIHKSVNSNDDIDDLLDMFDAELSNLDSSTVKSNNISSNNYDESTSDYDDFMALLDEIENK